MPIKYFTDSFRERLNNFPDEIQHPDLITFFTLSESDQKQIPIRSASYNRLGFALQLCTLRFMGFVPDELTRTPPAAVEYLAHQLNIDPSVLSEYPTRVQTRNDHLTRIMEYFDIRKASEKDVEEITSWLIERALEHDKPSLLYELICDKLCADKIIRPGITSLERVIAEARHEAETETLLRLESILTDECKSLLDSLLVSEREQERTLLSQLRQRANSNSPPSILRNIDNETELSIMEHTTDTMGYTEIVFALFDLLGMQFSPRIRDLGDQHLYQLNPQKRYPNLQPLLKSNIKRDIILKRWDDFLRVAGSLKMGWVTASLFISKLKSYPRQNALARALQEHGRLVKTIFILRYLENEQYRRRILTQINKGEKLHDLRKLIFFANEGKIRRKQQEGMSHQAACLNLITNAVVVWNTVYMNAAIEQLKAEGYPVDESDIKHLSPARHEHVNPYGRYIFEVEKELSRKELRPLRK